MSGIYPVQKRRPHVIPSTISRDQLYEHWTQYARISRISDSVFIIEGPGKVPVSRIQSDRLFHLINFLPLPSGHDPTMFGSPIGRPSFR